MRSGLADPDKILHGTEGAGGGFPDARDNLRGRASCSQEAGTEHLRLGFSGGAGGERFTSPFEHGSFRHPGRLEIGHSAPWLAGDGGMAMRRNALALPSGRGTKRRWHCRADRAPTARRYSDRSGDGSAGCRPDDAARAPCRRSATGSGEAEIAPTAAVERNARTLARETVSRARRRGLAAA